MDIPPFLFRRKQVTQVPLIRYNREGVRRPGRYGGGQPIRVPRLASACGRIRQYTHTARLSRSTSLAC